MASTNEEKVVEEVEATHAHGLMRRLHSHDDSPFSADELDSLRHSDERTFMVVHRLRAVNEAGVTPLLSGKPLTCKVDVTERYTTRSKVRVCTLYTVRLTHGEFTWTVKRKYKHFQDLHRDLYKHKMMISLLPLGRFAAQRQQLGEMSEEMPSLHSTDRVRRASSKPKHLEEYLNELLEHSFYRNYHGMLEFLDVSPLSFIKDLGTKGLEGFILKRSGGHRVQGLNCFGHHQLFYRWSRRWLVVKDSFLMYMNQNAEVISFVLLFDPELKVQVGRCYTDTKHGVCIQNFTRRPTEITIAPAPASDSSTQSGYTVKISTDQKHATKLMAILMDQGLGSLEISDSPSTQETTTNGSKGKLKRHRLPVTACSLTSAALEPSCEIDAYDIAGPSSHGFELSEKELNR